jgi:hypothetical protein
LKKENCMDDERTKAMVQGSDRQTLNDVVAIGAGMMGVLGVWGFILSLLVAIVSGTPAQKDHYARIAAGMGVLPAISMVVWVIATDFRSPQDDDE